MVDRFVRWGAVVALVMAAFALGCDESETPVVDFAELARRQVLRSEAALEFRAEDRASGRIGAGWSRAEIGQDGTTFAWAVGRRAELTVPYLGEGRRWLHLRCRPFTWQGADVQTLRVRLNGTLVGDLELLPGFRPYALELPEGATRVGDNVVELTFGYAARPSEHVAGSGDARLLAVAFDYLVLSEREAFAPPVAEGGVSHRVEGDALLQPARTELAFVVTVPADGVLAFEVEAGGDGAAIARVAVRRAGLPDAELFREDVGGGSANERIDLAAFSGERVEIVFQALAGESGGPVRWKQPRMLGTAPDFDRVTNVVLIVVDTLRADALSCYGGATPTPNIDALAASGVRFERAYAHAPMTGPSHSSMFTSLLPTEHGVRNNVQVLADRHVTLAELLRDAERRTAGFVSLGVLNAPFGTAQGFDEYDGLSGRDWWRTADAVNAEVLPWLADRTDAPFFLWTHYSDPHEPYAPPDKQYPAVVVGGPGGATLTLPVDAATRSLAVELPPGTHELRLAAGVPAPERALLLRGVGASAAGVGIDCGAGCTPSGRPNGMTEYSVRLPSALLLTNPTDATVTTDVWLRAQVRKSVSEQRSDYFAEVAFVDAEVGRLLDALRRDGRADRTLVVFTSDHGEGLGDHGLVGHVHQLYDSLLRVPLIVALPGRFPAGTVVEEPVGHVDLLPTIVDLFGLPDPVERTGRSLLPAIDAPAGEIPPLFAETWRPEASHDRQAVVRDAHKLIRTLGDAPTIELYDLRADPAESRDLGAGSELARRLLGLLDARMDEARLRGIVAEEGELSEEDLERLRALGYVR